MAAKVLVESILRNLNADDRQATYAVLDGASIPTLLDLLDEYEPEHTCLFSGRLDPELEQTAPYLIRLQAQPELLNHLLEHGWGHHWGIFAAVPKELPFIAVRKHFRTFLRVRGPEGNPLLFRYYDPRVLRVFLPTCDNGQAETIFGPVTSYFMENEEPAVLLRFAPDRAGEDGEAIELATGNG